MNPRAGRMMAQIGNAVLGAGGPRIPGDAEDLVSVHGGGEGGAAVARLAVLRLAGLRRGGWRCSGGAAYRRKGGGELQESGGEGQTPQGEEPEFGGLHIGTSPLARTDQPLLAKKGSGPDFASSSPKHMSTNSAPAR